MSKHFKTIAVITLLSVLITFVPFKGQTEASTDWITLSEMNDVPLDKTFTIKFNKPIKNDNIDGLFIYVDGKSIPIEFDAKDTKVFVKPVHLLTVGKNYEMRVVIGKKRYKMHFSTVKQPPVDDKNYEPTSNATMVYKGVTSVRSQMANNALVENVHHYEVNMGEGHILNMYVTDDYEKKYGKGFAYDETIDIIQSIEKFRKVKPYTAKLGTLNMFFYTNESIGPLPNNYQAALGTNRNNTGAGVPTEMVMNGSLMPYDFRSSYVHEFIHYFDFQSFITQYREAFNTYWGQDYHFWLLEGGAEYGGYFFYDYPENTKNNLHKDFVKPNKESIMRYAKQQGSNKQNLLFDVELDSFDDIYKASSNNYGIALSLFYYLVETYGYTEVYDYVRYIGETFDGVRTISQADKNATAKKFLGKTEAQVLQDWLNYFNKFDGELEPYKEITTGTVNYVFLNKDPLLSDFVKNWYDEETRLGINFLVNIEEWYEHLDYKQSHSFRANAGTVFKLVANGYPDVMANATGLIMSGDKLTNGKWLHAFGFNISDTEAKKLVKGVSYTIEPQNNNSTYQWISPENVNFEF